jgi:hypothetical protein
MTAIGRGTGRSLYSSVAHLPLFDPAKPFTPRTLSELHSLLSCPTRPRDVFSVGEFGDRMERWKGGRAAVGVSLCNIDIDGVKPGVLLTVRGAGLTQHPGECSLPGGKVDPEDNGVLETTFLRELREEVGIDSNVQVLGQMDGVRSRTGLEVGVVVASPFAPGPALTRTLNFRTYRPTFMLVLQHRKPMQTSNSLRSTLLLSHRSITMKWREYLPCRLASSWTVDAIH